MKLWRISNFPDLTGAGGRRVDGRWNTAGRPIVYAAESSALAMLEVLVRYGRKVMPPPFQLLEIEAPDTLHVTEFDHAVPQNMKVSRSWGDDWLRACGTPLARVPSVIAPKCFNYLINPAHEHAQRIRIVAHARHPWDVRLFR